MRAYLRSITFRQSDLQLKQLPPPKEIQVKERRSWRKRLTRTPNLGCCGLISWLCHRCSMPCVTDQLPAGRNFPKEIENEHFSEPYLHVANPLLPALPLQLSVNIAVMARLSFRPWRIHTEAFLRVKAVHHSARSIDLASGSTQLDLKAEITLFWYNGLHQRFVETDLQDI